jgi:geranylgeranyl pyrophosphate synthase
MALNPVITESPIQTPLTDLSEQVVSSRLASVEELLHTLPEGHNQLLQETISNLVDAGGKRIRPSICLNVAGMLDISGEPAVPLAAGIEMLHTATLVHDDLIDGADTRRGVQTLNSQLTSHMTVLVGDYMFARAANLVAQTDNVAVMDLFAETLMVILNGEIDQQFTRWQLDEDTYYRRIYAKTAAMFVLSARAPGLLKGLDQRRLKRLDEFGRCLGLAFQIVDDILDYNGDNKKTGKPVGGDLKQGLVTLPLILYSYQNPDDELVAGVLTEHSRDPAVIEELIARVRNSGAVYAALDEARRYAKNASDLLQVFPDTTYRNNLQALCRHAVEREI